MTSLFVDRRGVEIRLDGEALTFYEKDERIATVPIAPLERIYVCGDTLVRAGLLAKLGERGVGLFSFPEEGLCRRSSFPSPITMLHVESSSTN